MKRDNGNEKNMIKNVKKNKNDKNWEQNEKIDENCNFPFLENFCSTGSTHDKNDKKRKKTRGKLQFSIFCRIFAPQEAKMMKRD